MEVNREAAGSHSWRWRCGGGQVARRVRVGCGCVEEQGKKIRCRKRDLIWALHFMSNKGKKMSDGCPWITQ
jgi:hypothetical protein